MLQCVILYRNPANDLVGFISNEIGEIATFPNRDDAIKLIEKHPLAHAFATQIVELDEL